MYPLNYLAYCTALTFSFMVSMASRTHPTVPSPPHTRTRTLPGGKRVHNCRALEGGSSDRSNTWEKQNKFDYPSKHIYIKRDWIHRKRKTLAKCVNVSRVNFYLYRVQKGTKFSQQDLPHVVATSCVCQDQYRSPATPAQCSKLRAYK